MSQMGTKDYVLQVVFIKNSDELCYDVNHHSHRSPARGFREWGGEREKVKLTLVKVVDGRLALHCELLLGVLLVGVIRLDVVPGIELEDVVLLLQIARPELEGIGPLLVELGVMGAVGEGLLLGGLVLGGRSHGEGSHAGDERVLCGLAEGCVGIAIGGHGECLVGGRRVSWLKGAPGNARWSWNGCVLHGLKMLMSGMRRKREEEREPNAI